MDFEHAGDFLVLASIKMKDLKHCIGALLQIL